MEDGTFYEWSENHKYENGAFSNLGQRVLPSVALRKLPEAFGLQATKSWYPHYFNTEENLDYVGPMPDISYYGVDEMGEVTWRNFSRGMKHASLSNFIINTSLKHTVRMT